MTERKLLLVLLFSFASAVSVIAAEGFVTNPYRGIVLRNAFGLSTNKAEEALLSPAPAPKVQLLGITTILGDERAIVKILWPAAPGTIAREQTIVLKSHQSVGQIEVTEIDAWSGTVCVKIRGTPKTIGFETDPDVSRGPPAMLLQRSG